MGKIKNLDEMSEKLNEMIGIKTINIKVKECIIDFYWISELKHPNLIINYIDKDELLFQDIIEIKNISDLDFVYTYSNNNFSFYDGEDKINIVNKNKAFKLFDNAVNRFLFTTLKSYHNKIIRN